MTSLFRRLTEAVYDPQQEHLPQIGVEFQHRLLKSNTVKLQIWDFAYYGERTYHSFVPYFRNAKIVMIVGRTSTDHALENLRADFHKLQDNMVANSYYQVLLVSNVENEKPRTYSTQEGHQLAEKLGAFYIELNLKQDVGSQVALKLEEMIDKINLDYEMGQTNKPRIPTPEEEENKCTLI